VLGSLRPAGSGGRDDHVELVALRVGERRPAVASLVEVAETSGTEPDETLDRLLDVGHVEIDVDPVLPGFFSGRP
jgi:hypothetical protein